MGGPSQSEGGSPERLIPSLGVETVLAGRIFVLWVFFRHSAKPGSWLVVGQQWKL